MHSSIQSEKFSSNLSQIKLSAILLIIIVFHWKIINLEEISRVRVFIKMCEEKLAFVVNLYSNRRILQINSFFVIITSYSNIITYCDIVRDLIVDIYTALVIHFIIKKISMVINTNIYIYKYTFSQKNIQYTYTCI